MRVRFTGKGQGVISGLLMPLFGFLFCFSIWASLSNPAKIVGAIWFAFGLLFNVVQTKRRGGAARFDL